MKVSAWLSVGVKIISQINKKSSFYNEYKLTLDICGQIIQLVNWKYEERGLIEYQSLMVLSSGKQNNV